MRRAIALIALLALAAPASAFAHASVRATQPSYKQRLEQAPRTAWVRFDQAVKPLSNSIVVVSSDGRVVSGSTRSGADPHLMLTTLKRLPKGAYTVRWHAISSDGHVVSGVWTFGVGVAAPPPTEAYGASGPTRTEHFVRWAYFLALALLIGGLGFRLLIVRGPLPPRAESRFFKLTGLGVVAVLEVGIVAFLLRAEDALQLPFGRLLYGDLSPIASGTRFGTAFIAMTLGFSVVAALLFLAWLIERRVLLWLSFAVALQIKTEALPEVAALVVVGTLFARRFAWTALALLVALPWLLWRSVNDVPSRAELDFTRADRLPDAVRAVAGLAFVVCLGVVVWQMMTKKTPTDPV